MWGDQQLPRDLACSVKLGEPHDVFVRRHLKDRISRGVNDPTPRPQMLGGVPIHNRGAAASDVADHIAAGATRKGVDDVGGKPVRVGRKRPLQLDAGDLPVTGRAVFPGGARNHDTPRGRRRLNRLDTRERGDVTEAGRA